MASSPAVPPPWRSAKKTQVRSTKSLGASPSRLSRVSAASNPWQWQWWLKAPAPPDEPTEAEHAAAECIQRWGRGYNARWQFKAAVHGLAGKPSLQRARDYKRYMQPHTLETMKDGTHKVVPLPLSCPIECFHAFGEGIYCYMLWMRLMKRTFAVAFAFALGNMAHNWAGGNELDCGGNCWLSVHTIGNVGSLNASYGVSELLVLGVLLSPSSAPSPSSARTGGSRQALRSMPWRARTACTARTTTIRRRRRMGTLLLRTATSRTTTRRRRRTRRHSPTTR